jgi:putative colanic acid biosynthesis acetyltransferase WcaF
MNNTWPPNSPKGAEQAYAHGQGRSPYRFSEKLMRVLWSCLGQPLFSMTFHNWYGIRAALLRTFGARIGRPCRIRPTVKIEQPWNLTIGNNSSVGDHCILYCLGKVTIGDNVSLSQYAHLCAGTHDYRRPEMPLLRLPIIVENEVWIAADAFIGPGVSIAEGSIVGARAVVFRDTEPWTIYLGNPATSVKKRDFQAP